MSPSSRARRCSATLAAVAARASWRGMTRRESSGSGTSLFLFLLLARARGGRAPTSSSRTGSPDFRSNSRSRTAVAASPRSSVSSSPRRCSASPGSPPRRALVASAVLLWHLLALVRRALAASGRRGARLKQSSRRLAPSRVDALRDTVSLVRRARRSLPPTASEGRLRPATASRSPFRLNQSVVVDRRPSVDVTTHDPRTSSEDDRCARSQAGT